MRNPRDTVLAFIDALSANGGAEEIGAFFAEDVLSEELPNRLFPAGARRDKSAILAGAVRGRAVVAEQRLQVEQVVTEGATVVVAFTWSGTLRIDAGPMAAGTVLRARCLGVFEVHGGQITAHRSYDCYEPPA